MAENFKQSAQELIADKATPSVSFSQLPIEEARYAPLAQFASSVSTGIDDSLIMGVLPAVIQRSYAGSVDRELGNKPLSKEEFNRQGYGVYGDRFEQDLDETPTQTQFRFDRYVEQDISQQHTSGGGTAQKVLNFAGGFVGGMGGDLPLAFMPYAAVAGRLGTAGTALKTGWRAANIEAIANQTVKQASLEAAMVGGSKLKLAAHVGQDYMAEAVISSVAETAAWGVGKYNLGEDVSIAELALNAGVSVGASSAFLPFSLRSAFKEQATVLKFNEDIASVTSFMEDGDTVGASFKLTEFYEPARKIAQESEEFAFLLSEKVDISELTPEQVVATQRFARVVNAEELKKLVSNHLALQLFQDAGVGSRSQEDVARDVSAQTTRIFKAIDNQTHTRLSDSDWESLVMSGYEPSSADVAIREAYLSRLPDFTKATFTLDNRQTATRAINDYSGPDMSVIEDLTIDTLGRANPETGVVMINPTLIQQDWDAGMPHLTGEGPSASSEQKKIVFAGIDVPKLAEALGSAENYKKFILLHEAGHLALKHSRLKRSEWLKDEAINMEMAANIYAAERMGIDWDSLAKAEVTPLEIKVGETLLDPETSDLNPPVTAENFGSVRDKIDEAFGSKDEGEPAPKPQAEVVERARSQQERNMKDFESLSTDRNQFFVNQVTEVLGNESVLGTILSVPKDYSAATDAGNVKRKEHVRVALKEQGLESYSDVAEKIIDLQSQGDFYISSVNKFFNSYNPADPKTFKFDAKGIPDDVKNSVYITIGENSDDLIKAKNAVLQSLEEARSSDILKTVRDERIKNDLIAGIESKTTVKQKVEWLQTQLDGQQRSGINARTSAQVHSRAQIIIDAKPINDVLDKHGLWDLFIGAGNGKYLDVLRQETGGNPDAVKIYGKELRKHINSFAADIMVAFRTGDTPAKWKGVEAFEELVSAIASVRNSQIASLNRLGSNVRVRSDFSGWSQRWSNDTIKAVGFAKWSVDMDKALDWESTARAHGGRLVRKDGKEVAFDKDTFLSEWFYKITEAREQVEGSDVAKSFEQSRMVILKPDHEAKMLVKYSGEQNLGKLLMDQIRYRSEMIASLETFGSKPVEAIQEVMDKSGIIRGDNVGKFKYDTVLGTTRLLVNDLDNPVDVAFASVFKNVRKVSNLAFLPLSGFSALMDLPLIVSTLKYTGAEIGINEVMPEYLAALSRTFRGDKSGMSAYLRDTGANYDLVNNASLRQITGDVSGNKGFLDLAMSFMFEANGMLRITSAGQEAFADWTSRSLGKEAAAGKFSELRIESLKNFGFTDGDINVLLKSASKDAPDGISRIIPQTVEDFEVSNKLREYYLHYMKQAVLEPDAGAQAISRGNLKAGTVGGEVIRTGFQYSSFILGLSRVVFNRFANGYTGTQLNHVRAMSHLVAFVGTSLATAWFVTTLKDIAKGRVPINPLNMSTFEWSRIVSQSGILGIGEMPLDLLSGSLPISPIAKVPMNLIAGAVTGDREQVVKAVAPFFGSSLPAVGGPIKAMLGMAFLEGTDLLTKAEFENIQRF
jgi:hypothetical protein